MRSGTEMGAPGEIRTTRLLNALCEQAWEAWTNPELLSRWWGPEGFRNTFHVFEPRPGGKWKLTMHAPNGSSFENFWAFRELVRPQRIVLEHIDPAHNFTLFVTFEAQGERTRLTFRMVFDSIEECTRVKNDVLEANEQNLDRLEAVLAAADATTNP